jgi:hypothetical protein
LTVAGIKNKEHEFWKYLGEFDVVGLVETWVEEEGWERLERRMPREGERKVGKEKVWSLAYADDLVVLAREETGMKGMLGSMEKYMRRKKLTVNVEKFKMMVFRKGVVGEK